MNNGLLNFPSKNFQVFIWNKYSFEKKIITCFKTIFINRSSARLTPHSLNFYWLSNLNNISSKNNHSKPTFVVNGPIVQLPKSVNGPIVQLSKSVKILRTEQNVWRCEGDISSPVYTTGNPFITISNVLETQVCQETVSRKKSWINSKSLKWGEEKKEKSHRTRNMNPMREVSHLCPGHSVKILAGFLHGVAFGIRAWIISLKRTEAVDGFPCTSLLSL